MAAFAEQGMEEVSDDEKFAIGSQILMASPPGEIKEVLGDLKVLCPGELFSEDVLSGVFRSYNNQSNQVLSAGSQNIICDGATEIDADHYMDFSSGKVVKVDHINQEITNEDVSDVAPVEATAEMSERREAVESQLLEYVTSQYVKGTTVVNVCTQGNTIIALISGEKINLRNYWSGRWQSKFIVDLNSQKMDGTIKIKVHYFEEGNVQMTTDKSIDGVGFDFSDAESLGEEVRRVISEQESQVQDSLEDMYVNMSKETFKDMRRVLPITRQKMDWTGAQMQLAQGFKR